jgi:hypothetical protein
LIVYRALESNEPAIREILFGVGLNQLSDYFEERFPFIGNAQLRNAAGLIFFLVMIFF